MRHGCPHKHWRLARFQFLNHCGNERRYVVSRGSFINLLIGRFPHNENLSRTPSPRPLIQSMLEHHEMKRLEHSFVHSRGRVLRDLKHVRHGVAVASERQARVLVCRERRLIINSSDHVIQARVVALDAVRRLDCASEGHAPQRSQPATRLGINVARKFIAQRGNQRQYFALDWLQLWCLMDGGQDRSILSFDHYDPGPYPVARKPMIERIYHSSISASICLRPIANCIARGQRTGHRPIMRRHRPHTRNGGTDLRPLTISSHASACSAHRCERCCWRRRPM